MRTPSGMGVFYTKNIPQEVEKIVDAFCESKQAIRKTHELVQKKVQNVRQIMGFGIQVQEDWENKETKIGFSKNK